MNNLERNLAHSRAAYRFSIESLPSPESLKSGPIRIGSFEFSTKDQIHSMIIEIGWSFFCRYEACLEKYLKDKSVKLTKNKSLQDFLDENGIITPENYRDGIKLYRKIRNNLHHQDGKYFENENTEIHLLPIHMENFYNLFIWIGNEIENI